MFLGVQGEKVIESDLFPSFLQRVHQKSEMSHLVTVTESKSVYWSFSVHCCVKD